MVSCPIVELVIGLNVVVNRTSVWTSMSIQCLEMLFVILVGPVSISIIETEEKFSVETVAQKSAKVENQAQQEIVDQ